jgi:Eukaryotic initiation factor 4E
MSEVKASDFVTTWPKHENEHPLQTAWAFWYDKKQSKKTGTDEYRSKLQKIGTFDTVESFWQFYSYLRRPSTLENNVNLYLFRDGPNIAPMWEAFPRYESHSPALLCPYIIYDVSSLIGFRYEFFSCS